MHRSHRSASASTVGQSVHREPTKSQFAHLHDDSDAGRVIPTNRPATAIDYLGNGWNNEDDIAASWKFMTKQKNDMINGLRLENASWRNWAKQRHNLKTVSPRTLNWLKDSDTTWLYGPLYKANIDAFDISRFGSKTPNAAETAPQLALSSSTSPPGETSQSPTSQSSSTPTSPIYAGGKRLKPVLKHRTASELFKADTLFHVQSDLRLSRRIEPYSKAQETAVFKEHRQPKLRFNDSVEQCISIDTDAASDDELHQEDEDEDAGILMRISSKRPARSIVRIKPTKLKAESLHGMVESDESDDDPIYFGNPYTTRTDQDKPESSGRSNFRQGSRSGAHSSNSKSSSNATSGKYVNDEEKEDEDDQFVVSYTPPTPPNASSSLTRGSRHGKQHQHNSQSTDSTSSSLARAPSPGVSASSSTTVGASRRLSQEVTVVDSSKLTSPSASSARGIAGGVGQRAANIVANVKDIVHWASSFVYNSSTF
ncbi:hypothetical protein BGW42_005163 [Actinomortierella wolfii]|nr:hypothetical protein BGW42_005163 [Actinomortierella wolfii]